MPKHAGDFNADIPTAKIVVTFPNSDRAPINIEAPEMLTGGVDTIALALGIRSLIAGATSVPVNQNGTGAVYYPEGRRPAYERFVWARAAELDPEPDTVGERDVVSFHPDDTETLGDHPYTDPGDGRTECETCGKFVFPATHSCKGVPVTTAAKLRAKQAGQ